MYTGIARLFRVQGIAQTARQLQERQPERQVLQPIAVRGDHMTTAQAIARHLQVLPEATQQEVLDFVEFLQSRREERLVREDDASWLDLSLASAMRGMEDQAAAYTAADLKESFR